MATSENRKGISGNGRPEYGTNLEKVRRYMTKKICIDPDFSVPKIKVKEIDNTERKFKCCMCGTTYTSQKGNFLTSNNSFLWKGNNGYVPFCKACCETIMETLTAFYSGNEEHALRHICGIFDWYYNDTTSASTQVQIKNGQPRITMYPSRLNTTAAAKAGATFLNTIKDEEGFNVEFGEETTTDCEEDADSDTFKVTPQMVRTWGKGLKPEHYQYLEEEYAEWITKNVCNTKSQEEIYRNIALAQLDIRIARERGGKVADAQKALQELMNSANILPKQNSDNPFAEAQTFGTMLKKFEETRPVAEPAPEWRDVDGIRKYANTWLRGGLGKALRIKNDNTKLYDEAVAEMERYTIKREQFSNSADGMGSAIFDNEAGNSDDHDNK